MIILSDIHGILRIPRQLCKQYPDDFIIQIGDFGFGFVSKSELKLFGGLPDNLYFFPGNHDNVEKMKKEKNYLGRYGEKIIRDKKFFFVGGAKSVDIDERFIGNDWWSDEELNHHESNDCLDQWENSDADLLLSHDCSFDICSKYFGAFEGSHTQNLISEMLRIRKPRLHIFGHWHRNFDVTEKDVRYICIDKEQHRII